MNTMSVKKLSIAIATSIAMMVSSIPTYASDTEIYQPSKSGNVTLMLMLDISGSMNVSYSSRYDYNLGSGNGPQEGNVYRTIDTPILDALAQLPANRPPNNTRRMRHPASQMYERAWFDQVLASGDLGGFTRTQVRNEWNTYVAYSPRSYCQNSAMIPFREAGWQPTLITETNADGRGYQRVYCRLPVDATTIDSKYWIDSTVGANWIMDPVIGCPTYDTNGDGTPDERRCYARISRLKDALWDILNGNPAKGIAPLGDNIVLGTSTLGLHLNSYNGSEPNRPLWDPDNPDRVRSGSYARELGAVRVPARPLGEIVNGRTQRQILLDFIRNERLFGAHTNTPTARSFAETVSYMLGTSTLPSQELREIGLRNFNTWAYRSCVAWDNTRYLSGTGVLKIRPCVEWGFSDGRPVNNGGNGWWVDSYDIDFFEPNTRFFGAHPRIAGRDALLGLPRGNGTRIIIGYGESSPSGLPFSAQDSKKANGFEYEPPASIVNQKHPECSGQGVYVLSDGTPTVHNHEEAQMKLALGSHGGSFSCTGDSGNDQEWDCMVKLSETILDPSKNPMNRKYKTAVVGFAREYTDNRFAAYDPKKSVAENLAGIPTNDTSTMARFARWGIRGEGGWYSGSSSQSVVDSINSFIAALTTSIPDTVTGKPAIPIDPLNPLVLMNQGFYGTFVPRVDVSRTFWAGNMNKYDVKNNSLYGKNNRSLFQANGLISPTAVGYWDAGMTSKLPLRNNQRQLFTNENTGTNSNLTKVTVNALYDTSSPLGTASATANRNAWLNLLGYEVPVAGTPAAQADLAGTPELRQAGALLHSTPIILTQSGKISRGTNALDTTGRKDYVLYGSTQGILHIIDSSTGVEKVAFVPKEMMTNPIQKNNFQNVDNATGIMAYGIDGQWTTYTQYVPDGTGGFTVKPAVGASSPSSSADLSGKAVQWAYGGLRMGGRSYYALDLSDIDNPKLKFHIDPASAPAGSPLSYMGQSWSKPTLGFVKWKGSKRLVMFVGGGYDDGYENRTYDQSNGRGAGVYMFDAHDGSLLWWGSSHATTSTTSTTDATNHPALRYSVASNISTFDRNNDGLVDNLIFGDLGGQVFRVDLDNAHAPTDSLVTRVVRMYNGHQAGGLSPRFYETPSLSVHSGLGATGQFGVISVASGNRSSPLAVGAESAKDALFVIYDHDVLKSGMTKKGATLAVTDAATDNLVVHTRASMTSNDDNQQVKADKQGWKYYLSGVAGELKGYASPRVVDNFLFLTTYTPKGGTVNQNSCDAGILGESFQEVFCLPGGVCSTVNNKDQRAILNITAVDTGAGDGSPRRYQVGVGITQPSVGQVSNAAPNKYGIVAPKALDCTDAKNADKPECLTEVSSITNKPVRWYEDSPRSQ